MTDFTDAQALTLVTGQAFKVNQRIYETRYPDFDYGRLVYVDTSGPEWSPGIITYQSSNTGAAKWQSGYAKDVPLADVSQSMEQRTFQMAAIGYQWNIEEVNTALQIGAPLPDRRARAARLAYEKFMYDLAIKGDDEKGYKGLINFTGVPTVTAPADGTGSVTFWVNAAGELTKTPAQIVRDINNALTGVYLQTSTIEMADTILMPVEAYNAIAGQPFGLAGERTILSWIQENNIYTIQTGRPLTIRADRNLGTASTAGNTGRLIAYKNDQEYVKLLLPMPHRFIDVWRDGPFNYQVPGIFRTGGIDVLTTAAMRYVDGISQPPTP